MADKESFVLYHDLREPLSLLNDEECGRLFRAILDYSEFGVIPDFTGALQMAFAFIRKGIDRDAAKWEAKREKRVEAGRLGGLKRAEMLEDAKQSQANQANATFAKQTKQNQANQAVPVPVPVPVPAPVPAPAHNMRGKADKPPAHAHGQFGWVKLTDEQYTRLVHELGQAEVDRCIQYVDESAQATGNKNRWKDWNLVLRRCSRDGWGRRDAQGGSDIRSPARYTYSEEETL